MMRAVGLVVLGLAAGVLVWAWWLPALRCFAVAGLVALCLEWDHLVAWLNFETYVSPKAQRIMDELKYKADIYDRLVMQNRIYEEACQVITDQSRRY